jgi:hypothetical protein
MSLSRSHGLRTWQKSRRIEGVVKRLFGPVRRPSKNTAKAVDQAEKQLRRSLPRTLRDFGLCFGWNGPLASARETLLPPNKWRIRGGALVFCVENQGVVLWGIRQADLGKKDPPVKVAENREPYKWTPDHDRLSDFFLTLAYWQGIVGANLFRGDIGVDEAADPKALAKLTKLCSEIPLGRNSWGVRVFEGDGKLFLLQKTGRLTCLVEGTRDAYRTARELQQLERQTGLEFTYALPRDESPEKRNKEPGGRDRRPMNGPPPPNSSA